MLPIASNKDTLDTVLTSQPKNLRSNDVDIMRNIVYWSEIPGTLKLLQVTLFKIWKLFKKRSGSSERFPKPYYSHNSNLFMFFCYRR